MNRNAITAEWHALKGRLPDRLLYFLERAIATNDSCLQRGVYYTSSGGCLAYWVSYFTEEPGHHFGPILCGVSCRNLIHAWDNSPGFRRRILLPLIRAEQRARREPPMHVEKQRRFLRALAVQVQGLSDPLCERGFRVKPTELRPLISSDLVSTVSAFAAPPPGDIHEPLAVWTGGPEPNMDRLIYQNDKRQKALVPRSTRIVCATASCGKLFGVRRTGSLPRPLQASHALSVAALFVHYLEHEPETARRWWGEDALSLHGTFGLEKLPDAFLFDEDERPRRVIEVLGIGYTAAKLHALHRECDRLGISYALH